MNKKLVISIAAIAIVAIAAIGGTIAYFSDKEISMGNNFTAGSIDLKVGDSNVVVNGPNGATQGWEPKDLTEERFFNLSDLKPGDNGRDTIKIKVGSNPAWVCGEISGVVSTEETLTNPEVKVQDTDAKGEIDEQLYIKFFADANCNGTQDVGDVTLKDWTLFANVGKFSIADKNIGSAFQPGVETCVTKTWCFGTPSANGCDGSSVNNKSQTDKLVANIALEAIQIRHNDNFTCTDSCANVNCSVGPAGEPISGSTCYHGQCVGFGTPAWRFVDGNCELSGIIVLPSYESEMACRQANGLPVAMPTQE